jgi:nitrate reductase gamma subunit
VQPIGENQLDDVCEMIYKKIKTFKTRESQTMHENKRRGPLHVFVKYLVLANCDFKRLISKKTDAAFNFFAR